MRTADRSDELADETEQTVTLPNIDSLYSYLLFTVLDYTEDDIDEFKTHRYTDASSLTEIRLYGPQHFLQQRLDSLKEILTEDQIGRTKFETFKVNYIVDDGIPEDTLYAEVIETENILKFSLTKPQLEEISQ